MAGVVVLINLYIMLVILPVNLYYDEGCLSRGFSGARVTVTLETYCVNNELKTHVPTSEAISDER